MRPDVVHFLSRQSVQVADLLNLVILEHAALDSFSLACSSLRFGRGRDSFLFNFESDLACTMLLVLIFWLVLGAFHCFDTTL